LPACAEGLLIGFFVFVCILGLGGPTGIAANPARDFSPRLAHWLLPIPGKGPSEWYYSWVPVVGPFVGGCAAAGLYAATQLLNHSNVPGTSTFPSTTTAGA
jgi:glycerol uptake facilitator protein